jgi:hypothetical protein
MEIAQRCLMEIELALSNDASAENLRLCAEAEALITVLDSHREPPPGIDE